MQAKLDLRIRQLHEAMGQMRTEDLSDVRPDIRANAKFFYVGCDFSGGASDAELANIVSLCIANIACLKDHLKAWCKADGKPFQGDALIDSNQDVAIIHDLWNRDKHCDLEKSRSKLFPEVRNVIRAARLTTQSQAGSWVAMTMDPRTGQLKTHGDGKVELVIDAEVFDSTGARVGDLTKIAERAVAAWEQALIAAGVSIPPR